MTQTSPSLPEFSLAGKLSQCHPLQLKDVGSGRQLLTERAIDEGVDFFQVEGAKARKELIA